MWLVRQPFREIVPAVLSNVATPLPHPAARRKGEGSPRTLRLSSVCSGASNGVRRSSGFQPNVRSHRRKPSGPVATTGSASASIPSGAVSPHAISASTATTCSSALRLRPPFERHPFLDVARRIDDWHPLVAAGVEKTNALHADQRQLAYINDDGTRGVVDLRFDLTKVFDVELTDQLHDQGVS